MSALWAQEAAERFWIAAGGPPPFPRDLREAIPLALPLAVVELPDLCLAAVDQWLGARGVSLPLGAPDRALRAALLARGAAGLVFVHAGDTADERRFSLAHEVAHYLIEYALPHARASKRLGAEAAQALAAGAAAPLALRIDAALAGLPPRLHLHLLERDGTGRSRVAAAERQADLLALELLAPVESVRARFPAGSGRAAVESALRQAYGLPARLARDYAQRLEPQDPRDTLAHSLRQALHRPPGGDDG